MKSKNFIQYRDEFIQINFVILKTGIIRKTTSIKYFKHINKNTRIKRKESRYTTKEQIIDYLGGKCKHCGLKSNYVTVFDIHHLKPNKEYGKRYCTLDFIDIRKDLDGCILLCANCHRILHEKERNNL